MLMNETFERPGSLNREVPETSNTYGGVGLRFNNSRIALLPLLDDMKGPKPQTLEIKENERKTLTLMAPAQSRDFKADATAWARLHYAEEDGSFVGTLEITPQLNSIMQSPPNEFGATEGSLWEQMWNRIIWGSQYDLDRIEDQARHSAEQDAKLHGKGLFVGKGRKHWSSMLIHNSYYSPYPYELRLKICEQVAFVWDELVDKTQAPADQRVGDYAAATYQGKPVGKPKADHSAAAAPQAAMSKAAPPKAPEGKGKAARTS